MDDSTSPKLSHSSADPGKPSDSPLGQMAQAMEQSLGGVHASVGTMMSTLAQSMKRTMDMTQSMNSLMETYIQRSVRLTATVATADHLLAPVVTVAIANRSQIPLPEAVLCLSLAAHTTSLETTNLSSATPAPGDKAASASPASLPQL
ncbi:hypothetical protein H4R34_003665 [Dimargaris verticillata]|uniref:Uncharacterized protein n=1 Tax=Dimargaris verticillata TaxID=2761393 RepID=A0A9W8B5S7_9FUNG|nr:hypothetical protein H4R34_003665 [Dimargaris verticillata]